MPYTATRIAIPLHDRTSYRQADNRATLTSALNAGWITITYVKSDGTTASRMATRNPSIVGAYGTDDDREAIASDNHYPGSILYFDHAAGGLRSFRVDGIVAAYIPADPPEINH